MRLTPEHLEELCANALVDVPEYIAASDPPAFSVAYEVIKAMRTPITADALTAAGWRYDERDRAWYTSAGGLIVEFTLADQPTTLIETNPPNCRSLPGCRTMYDLGELVRLLGGAS